MMTSNSDENAEALTQAQIVWSVLGIVGLVIASAVSAGLQVSLYSIDRLFLRVLSMTGTPLECARARKLLAVLDLEHWTLVALILFNASCMMSLPILLEHVLGQLAALVVSITALLFLGEVVPLSLFVRFAVPICASLVGIIWAAIILTAPVSYPVGKLLDRVLGTNEELLDRDELAALIALPSIAAEDGDGADAGGGGRARGGGGDGGDCGAHERRKGGGKTACAEGVASNNGNNNSDASTAPRCDGKSSSSSSVIISSNSNNGGNNKSRSGAAHAHTLAREGATASAAGGREIEMTTVLPPPPSSSSPLTTLHSTRQAHNTTARTSDGDNTGSNNSGSGSSNNKHKRRSSKGSRDDKDNKDKDNDDEDDATSVAVADTAARARYELQEMEVKMLRGAMQLSADTVKEHLRTSNADAFMLSSRDALDAETISRILRTGYSRIPVYFGDDRKHVIGALIVNSLVRLCFSAPETPPLVGDYPLREVLRLSEMASLHDAYTAFRSGSSNMAVVYNDYGSMVGLLTLTDVLAALYHANPNTTVGITDHGLRRQQKVVKLVTGLKYLNATTGKAGLGLAVTASAAAVHDGGAAAAAAAAAGSISHRATPVATHASDGGDVTVVGAAYAPASTTTATTTTFQQASVPRARSMNPDRLYDDFAFAVRCESSDTVVFVACPRGGRYGDVRKTLAGLLQRPFETIRVAPYDEGNNNNNSNNDDDATMATMTPTTAAAAAALTSRLGASAVDVRTSCATSPSSPPPSITPYDDAAVVQVRQGDGNVIHRVQIVVCNEHGAWVRL